MEEIVIISKWKCSCCLGCNQDTNHDEEYIIYFHHLLLLFICLLNIYANVLFYLVVIMYLSLYIYIYFLFNWSIYCIYLFYFSLCYMIYCIFLSDCMHIFFNIFVVKRDSTRDRCAETLMISIAIAQVLINCNAFGQSLHKKEDNLW